MTDTPSALARQRSRAGSPAHRRALCASGRATDTTALSVFDVLGFQSVGKAEYRHAKVIGFRLAGASRWLPVRPPLVIHSVGKIT
jgi:hypothetical protein